MVDRGVPCGPRAEQPSLRSAPPETRPGDPDRRAGPAPVTRRVPRDRRADRTRPNRGLQPSPGTARVPPDGWASPNRRSTAAWYAWRTTDRRRHRLDAERRCRVLPQRLTGPRPRGAGQWPAGHAGRDTGRLSGPNRRPVRRLNRRPVRRLSRGPGHRAVERPKFASRAQTCGFTTIRKMIARSRTDIAIPPCPIRLPRAMSSGGGPLAPGGGGEEVNSMTRWISPRWTKNE